jgi:SAM-dependent MidA family methyltransferase
MTGSAPPSTFPPLDPAQAQHSRTLEQLIRTRIAAAGGWIDFEAFMELALYAPGLGYYSAGSTKLGPDGDFVTAPEISDLFSRCVARQCAQILDTDPAGEILEIGAGSGRMAGVILTQLAAGGRPPARYRILELSADLRQRQREHLQRLPRELIERIEWLERLPEAPLSGVVLANEVLDALPVQRVVVHERGLAVLGIGLDGEGALTQVERPAPDALRAAYEALLPSLRGAPSEGYCCELSPRIGPWLATLAGCLERGVMLLFDYGLPRAHYYHPERADGTLRCHYRHRAHDDPLLHLGLQDITAWVDFTAVAEAADGAGLEVLGFATQAAFLLGTGLADLAEEADGTVARVARTGEARRLIMPGEMGEAIKVMALGRGWQAPLSGFAHQDLRHLL